jgi:ATP/maltotriose-dependent transcriptional regulator MalT/DNA-binding SARP family transcriptional activator
MPGANHRPTRLHIPHVPGAIDRPRLLESLQSARERRLTLVSAPPGYGKTTLVAQYVQGVSLPVAWHTIEDHERDVPLLDAHARATLEALVPGIRELPPAQSHPSHELAALIANHLRRILTDDILYVIDDLHELEGAPDAEVWLRTLVMLAPPAFHLILISRAIPDLPFVEMLAHGEVLAIGQEQLQFDEEDTAALARSLHDTHWTEDEVAALTARLQGWPAGIRLALQPLPEAVSAAILGEGAGPEALFAQLARQTLETQLPGLRGFLLAASTLRRISPEICTDALGLADSDIWLNTAWNNQLFIFRAGHDYVLHILFRSFLQEELRRQDPSKFSQFHRRAAQWFEGRDEIEEAFTHYLAAGDHHQVVDISERVALSYYGQGKLETLLRWRSQMESAHMVSPRLSYACAIIYGDRYEYDRAEAELVNVGSVMGAVAEVQHAFLDQQRGRHKEVIASASHLLELSSNARPLHARALRIVGVSYLLLGDATQAAQYLESSVALYRASGGASHVSHALQDLQVAYTRLGRLDDAGRCLQEVVALRRSLGGAGALALALNNLGYYYHQRGDYGQALATYHEGLSAIAQIQDRRAESYLRWSLGDLLRDLGSLDDALGLYSRALDLTSVDDEPRLYCSILVSAAALYRWQQRIHQAISAAEQALAVAQKYNLGFERALARANLWTARAVLDLADEALNELEQAVQELEEQGAWYEILGVLIMRAAVCLLRGDASGAEHTLRQACETAREVGSAQPLVAELFHTPSLGMWLESQPALLGTCLGEELAHLRDMQKAVRLPGHREEPSPLTSQPVYSLRILTLGSEAVLRNGQAVPVSQWRGALNRELFLYLLFHGAQTREAICAMLWPEADEKQARDSFHTALYQMRQAVGKEVIVFENNGYHLNPSINLWCDAFELERLVHDARLLPSHDARTEDLWRKAVALYLGDFLPSVDATWALSSREVMRDDFIEALAGLGECARARRDWPGAIAYYRQALDVDPFREDLHRAIMTCYAIDMGQKKPALDQFESLRKLLEQELGVPPSEDTLSLASQLFWQQ